MITHSDTRTQTIHRFELTAAPVLRHLDHQSIVPTEAEVVIRQGRLDSVGFRGPRALPDGRPARDHGLAVYRIVGEGPRTGMVAVDSGYIGLAQLGEGTAEYVYRVIAAALNTDRTFHLAPASGAEVGEAMRRMAVDGQPLDFTGLARAVMLARVLHADRA